MLNCVQSGNSGRLVSLVINEQKAVGDVNLERTDRCDFALIHHAAAFGHASFIEALVAFRADVKATTMQASPPSTWPLRGTTF